MLKGQVLTPLYAREGRRINERPMALDQRPELEKALPTEMQIEIAARESSLI